MPIFDITGKRLMAQISIAQHMLVNHGGIPDNSTADKYHEAISLLREVLDELHQADIKQKEMMKIE